MSPLLDFLNIARKKQIRPWIDFRSFMEQRRAILNRPLTALKQDEQSTKNYKSPVQFAIQSVILAVLLATIITYPARHKVDLIIADQQETNDLYLAKEKEKIARSGKSFEDIQKKQDDLIKLAKNVEDRNKNILKYLSGRAQIESAIIPVTLLFGSYIFSFFLGRKNSTNPYITQAKEIHLTYFIAILFWPSTICTIVLNILAYREAFNFPSWMYWGVEAASWVIGFWIMILIYDASKKLSPTFEKSTMRIFFAAMLTNGICGLLYEPSIDLAWYISNSM